MTTTLKPALNRLTTRLEKPPAGLNCCDRLPNLKPPSATIECERCRGFGFVRPEVPLGHPLFGQALPCPNCAEKRQAVRKAGLKAQINQLEGWLREATFETFHVTAENRAAFEAALEFTEHPTGLLTLYGANGPGKTHLLAAIHHRVTANGMTSLFTTLPDLVSQHKEAIGRGETEAFYQFVSRHRVLLLDEVDKADLRHWTREQTFRLFNRRYNLAEEVGTGMTLNKNPNVYDGELAYLFSRMRDDRHRCVYMAGDNRPQASLLGRLAALARRKDGRQ